MGVRYNAEKKAIGNFFSTKVPIRYSFIFHPKHYAIYYIPTSPYLNINSINLITDLSISNEVPPLFRVD